MAKGWSHTLVTPANEKEFYKVKVSHPAGVERVGNAVIHNYPKVRELTFPYKSAAGKPADTDTWDTPVPLMKIEDFMDFHYAVDGVVDKANSDRPKVRDGSGH